MSFHEQVAKIRYDVLNKPEYVEPIKAINARIDDKVKRGTEIYRPKDQAVEVDVR